MRFFFGKEIYTTCSLAIAYQYLRDSLLLYLEFLISIYHISFIHIPYKASQYLSIVVAESVSIIYSDEASTLTFAAGRAGLVACCWMLKLGLCGWIVPTLEDTISYPVCENGDDVVKVHKGTLELVERVIGVVRRRRSVKAIETYEQVRFLVEFVEYLKVASAIPKS